MVGAFQHDELHRLGRDAHGAQHFAVKQLGFAADHCHQHPVDIQTRAGTELAGHAAHHRALEHTATLADGQHFSARRKRRVTHARIGGHRHAQHHIYICAHTCGAGHGRHFGVVHQAQRHRLRVAFASTLLQQGLQHASGVAVTARPWVVLGVSDQHGSLVLGGQSQGLCHGFTGV